MSKQKKRITEYRNYFLPPTYPVILLTGDEWRISDVQTGRLHFHNCLEIGLCEEGSGTLEFSDHQITFHEGDITFIADDVVHTTYSAPGTSSKWSYIFLDLEEVFSPYFSLNVLSECNSIHHIIHSYSAVFPRVQYPDIYSIITYIIRTLLAKETNYKFMALGAFMSFLTEVMNLYGSSKNEELFNKQNEDGSLSIVPALDYVRRNYREDFSMDDLAVLCDMSPTHFRRTFSSVMDIAPLDYLIQVRIEKASLLLRNTEMPILDISEEVGFRSLSSFNRHFSSIIGSTPRDFRKEHSTVNSQTILKFTGWLTPPKEVKPQA